MTADGKVYTWGYNKHGQCGIVTADLNDITGDCTCNDGITRPTPAKIPSQYPIVSISMGHEHTAVLDSANRMYCCGSNEFGQLGCGVRMSEGSHKSEFTAVDLSTMKSVTAISCGGDHTLALTTQKEGNSHLTHKNRKILITCIRWLL